MVLGFNPCRLKFCNQTYKWRDQKGWKNKKKKKTLSFLVWVNCFTILCYYFIDSLSFSSPNMCYLDWKLSKKNLKWIFLSLSLFFFFFFTFFYSQAMKIKTILFSSIYVVNCEFIESTIFFFLFKIGRDNGKMRGGV